MDSTACLFIFASVHRETKSYTIRYWSSADILSIDQLNEEYGTAQFDGKMKTRKKSSPEKSPLIGNSKRTRKKRDVDKLKVAITLNELMENGSSSINRINTEDLNKLTKRFKVSQQIIKKKIAELQPIVKM